MFAVDFEHEAAAAVVVVDVWIRPVLMMAVAAVEEQVAVLLLAFLQTLGCLQSAVVAEPAMLVVCSLY